MKCDSLTANKPIQDTIQQVPAEPITQTPPPAVENKPAEPSSEDKKKPEDKKKVEEQAKHNEEAQKQVEEQKARNAKIQNKVKQAYTAAHSGDAATAKRLVNEITAEGGEWRAKGQAMKNEFKDLGVYDFD